MTNTSDKIKIHTVSIIEKKFLTQTIFIQTIFDPMDFVYFKLNKSNYGTISNWYANDILRIVKKSTIRFFKS